MALNYLVYPFQSGTPSPDKKPEAVNVRKEEAGRDSPKMGNECRCSSSSNGKPGVRPGSVAICKLMIVVEPRAATTLPRVESKTRRPLACRVVGFCVFFSGLNLWS